MERRPTDLQPPPQAITQMARAFEGMQRYVKNASLEEIFPAYTGDQTGTNKYTTLNRQDNGHVTRFVHAKNSSGLAAIISGVHMLMRAQVNEVHEQQYAAVEATMRDVSVPYPNAALKRYTHQLHLLRRHLTLGEEDVKKLDEHLEHIETWRRAKGEGFTLYGKVALLKEATALYGIIMRSPEPASMTQDERQEHLKKYDDALESAFGELNKEFLLIKTVPLHLKDPQGKEVVVEMPNFQPYGFAGYVFGASAGKTGFLDRARFPDVWGNLLNSMLGNTGEIAAGLQSNALRLANRLQEEHGYSEADAQQMVNAAGFNFSPQRWGAFTRLLQQEIPKAAFQEHVARLSADFSSEAPPLYHLHELVTSCNQSLTAAGASEKELLVLPNREDLVPKTRFDYYGLLGALACHYKPRAMIWPPPDEGKFELRIQALRNELCPVGENSNLVAQSVAQQPPSPRQMVAIREMLKEIREGYGKIRTKTDAMDELLDIASREAEKGTHSRA